VEFYFLEALKLVDHRPKREIELAGMGIDWFEPVGLGKRYGAENHSMLTEPSVQVFLAVAKAFGGFMQFNIACDQDGSRVRGSEGSHAFDQLQCFEIQLTEGGFGIDMEPHYIDLAIRRWQNLTGKLATHAETGQSFNA